MAPWSMPTDRHWTEYSTGAAREGLRGLEVYPPMSLTEGWNRAPQEVGMFTNSFALSSRRIIVVTRPSGSLRPERFWA
jgi:hypothetical protein